MSEASGDKGLLKNAGKLRYIQWIAVLIGAGILLWSILAPITKAEEQPAAPAIAQPAQQSETEQRLGDVLSLIDGAGSVRTFITWESGEGAAGDAVRGVIIVAEGAEDIAVQMELRRAARVALHISAQQVEVFAMKNEEAMEL